MATNVRVLDLTTLGENGESAAVIYFENLEGSIHVYRDGTVVLSSPAGTTVTSLRHTTDALWRRTQFLGMLARLGSNEQGLAAAAGMIDERETALGQQGFPGTVEIVAERSAAHFRDWCRLRDIDPDTLDTESLDELLDTALAQVRSQ